MEDGAKRVIDTNAIELVKDTLHLNKDLSPCINLDSLFCLSNFMNIQELAMHQSLLSQETINNAIVVYFAYSH